MVALMEQKIEENNQKQLDSSDNFRVEIDRNRESIVQLIDSLHSDIKQLGV